MIYMIKLDSSHICSYILMDRVRDCAELIEVKNVRRRTNDKKIIYFFIDHISFILKIAWFEHIFVTYIEYLAFTINI